MEYLFGGFIRLIIPLLRQIYNKTNKSVLFCWKDKTEVIKVTIYRESCVKGICKSVAWKMGKSKFLDETEIRQNATGARKIGYAYLHIEKY